MTQELTSHDAGLTGWIQRHGETVRFHHHAGVVIQRRIRRQRRGDQTPDRTAQALVVSPGDRKPIGLKHKSTDKGCGWTLHQLTGGRALMNHAIPEHSHAITNGQSFSGVMGDDQPSRPTDLKHGGQFAAQAQTDFNIQVGKRFIQQNDTRCGGQSPRQSKTLALATGQLMGKSAVEIGKPHQIQQPAGATVVLPRPQTEAGVLPGGEVRKKRIVLKHHPHATTFGRQPPPGPCDGALLQTNLATVRTLEPRDQSQQRGLATSGRAQQADKLPSSEIEVDAPERPVIAIGGIAMPEIAQFDGAGWRWQDETR